MVDVGWSKRILLLKIKSFGLWVCYCIVINTFRRTENSTTSPPTQNNSAEIHGLLTGRIPHHLYKGIINGNSSANLTNSHKGGYRIPMSPDPLKQSKAGAYWCSKSILHYIHYLMNYNTPRISMIYLVFLHVSKSLKGSLFQPPLHYFLTSNKNNSWFLRIFYLHSFPECEEKKWWNGTQNYWDPNNPHSSAKRSNVWRPDFFSLYEYCKNTEHKLQIDPLFWLGNPLKPPPHLETSIFAALHGNLLPQVLLASSVLRQFNRRFQWTRIQRNPLECLRHWYTLHLVDTPWILCHYSPFTQNK